MATLWKTKHMVDLRRAELGAYFRGCLGPDWQPLVAARIGRGVDSVRRLWPKVERFKIKPRCLESPVFSEVEDIAIEYGFRSTLDAPARRLANALTRASIALRQRPADLPVVTQCAKQAQ